MSKRVRVGVLGQGRSGYNIHVRGLREMTDKYEIVAVADPLQGQLEDAVNQLGVVGYTDYKELIKRDDLDLVVNATPSHLHVPISLEIMEAGHNLLSEKPLARRVSDVDKLIAKSKETGKLFAIYQQSRFAPYFQKVREVIDSGVLGKVVMVRIAFNGFGRRWDWQTLQNHNAGNLLNTGPHPMDQALQLFGTDVMPEVTCIMERTPNCYGDAEDFVKIILKGKDRPVIDLEISSCCAYSTHMYNVDGTLGGIKGDSTHLDWKYFKPEEAPEQHLISVPMPERKYCSEQLTWHEGSWDLPEEHSDWFQYMALTFYTHLYETIVNGAPLVIPPEHVRQQISVIEECHRQNPLPKMQ